VAFRLLMLFILPRNRAWPATGTSQDSAEAVHWPIVMLCLINRLTATSYASDSVYSPGSNWVAYGRPASGREVAAAAGDCTPMISAGTRARKMNNERINGFTAKVLSHS
jgi:hypothetical protein